MAIILDKALHEKIIIENASDIPYARQSAISAGRAVGFNDVEIEHLAIAISELATNVDRHTSGIGEVTVTKIHKADAIGIELTSCDSGPGILDIESMMQDHISSKDSLGCGLGAVKRVMDEFNIISTLKDYSHRHSDALRPGTTIVARKWKDNNSPNYPYSFHYITRAMPGEDYNGDACTVLPTQNGLLTAVVDGLGHGKMAHEASSLAIKIITDNVNIPLEKLTKLVNSGLKGTRGAAIAIVKFYDGADHFDFVGIGNISTSIKPRQHTSPYSFAGVIGKGQNIKTTVQRCGWSPDSTIVLWSDGIHQRNLYAEDSSLFFADPSLICHRLLYHHANIRDDATVCVIQGKACA